MNARRGLFLSFQLFLMTEIFPPPLLILGLCFWFSLLNPFFFFFSYIQMKRVADRLEQLDRVRVGYIMTAFILAWCRYRHTDTYKCVSKCEISSHSRFVQVLLSLVVLCIYVHICVTHCPSLFIGPGSRRGGSRPAGRPDGDRNQPGTRRSGRYIQCLYHCHTLLEATRTSVRSFCALSYGRCHHSFLPSVLITPLRAISIPNNTLI